MTRILVVDDDRPQAEEFGVLLRHAGCEVTLAGNGLEAMDLLRRNLPEVVLTDLDQLVAKIQEVEARDPRIAQGLRRLAERFEYQKLLDLFGPEVPSPASISPVFPNGANVLA